MSYVDGYVVPVSKKKLNEYKKMAKLGGKLWREHGALHYFECVGDDLNVKFGMPFPKQLKTKSGETVIFAFIVFKSKAHRNSVNAKVMKDPRLKPPPKGKKMPFDMNRMLYGGFKTIVQH